MDYSQIAAPLEELLDELEDIVRCLEVATSREQESRLYAKRRHTLEAIHNLVRQACDDTEVVHPQQ